MVADIPDDQQPDDAETHGKQKVIQVVKSNYTIAPPPRLFRRPLDGAIEWLGESGMSIEECYQPPRRGARGPIAADRGIAESLLKEVLKGGSVPATDIMKEAKAHGLSEMTVRRAKEAVGAEALKIGHIWHWRLPHTPPSRAIKMFRFYSPDIPDKPRNHAETRHQEIKMFRFHVHGKPEHLDHLGPTPERLSAPYGRSPVAPAPRWPGTRNHVTRTTPTRRNTRRGRPQRVVDPIDRRSICETRLTAPSPQRSTTMSSNDEFPPLIDRGHPDFWAYHIDPEEGYDDGADDDLSTIDGGGRWVNGVFYCAPPYPPETMRPNRVNPFRPVAVRLSDVDAATLTWVWPGWIPAGVLTILGGHVGDGKSTAIAALVAALTSGAPLPDGTTVPALNVLILGIEDDPARVLRPRLIANGADASRVLLLDPDTRLRLDLHRDSDWLRDIICENDIRLVVIDPLGSILRRSDRASEGDIRAELEPLMRIIDHTGVAVVGVMRVGKGGSARRPAQSLVGSSAFPAIARSVIMIARDRSADTLPGARVMEVVKSNYVDPPPPISLSMDDSGAVRWHGPVANTIDELAAMGDDPRLSRSEREEAAIFLREVLADGPVNAKIVMEKALAAGFSEITIRRAKKDATIGSYRVTRVQRALALVPARRRGQGAGGRRSGRHEAAVAHDRGTACGQRARSPDL